MKTDKSILVALFILIILIALLLFFSLKRDEDISKAIKDLKQSAVLNAQAEVDYDKIQVLIEETVRKEIEKSVLSQTNRPGINGNNGIDGQNGLNGRDGQNGLSVYDLWLEAGNYGSLEEFLESIKGEKGDQGPVPILRNNNCDNEVQYKLPTDMFWQVVPCVENK